MADWTQNLPPAAQAYLEGKRLDEVECVIPDLPGIAPGLSLLRFGRGSDEFEHECILPSGAFQLSSH